MPRKIQVNRLEKDELTYELTIRGIATGNCEEMRRRLSQAIQLEKDGDSLKYPEYPFSFDQDYGEIQKKIKDLTDLIGALSSGKGSNEALKIQTKINHTLGRLDNMVCKDTDQQNKKSEVLAITLSLMEKFSEKIDDYEQKKAAVQPITAPAAAHVVPPALSFIEGQVGANTFHAGLGNASRSSSIQEDTHQAHGMVRVNRELYETPGKVIPPHKWNLLRFSGDKKSGVSINAFLERVEELRVARNVSKEMLLSSGIDLFLDKAYQFYKDCRCRVQNWDEMVTEFREEYLASNYEDDLFEELQKRTQHSTESIGVYLAIMSSYFNRLRFPISEEAKLRIIMKNLHPFYLERLSDPMPTTIVELRSACRSMEARRDMIKNYTEPSTRRSSALEKDLAFIDVDESIQTVGTAGPSTEPTRVKEIVCFKCNRPGHKAIGCAMMTKVVCFKCRKEGFTVRTCPTCSKKGNECRRS